jgi:hypothetical protein
MNQDRKWEPMLNSVALLQAVLCADCEIISNSGGESCEVCGSRSLLSLGRILGGCIEGERAILLNAPPSRLRNGFTVLVNPDAVNVLQRQRRLRNSSG